MESIEKVAPMRTPKRRENGRAKKDATRLSHLIAVVPSFPLPRRVRGISSPCAHANDALCNSPLPLCVLAVRLADGGALSSKRTSTMAGLVARFLPVVEAFFVANARDPKGGEKLSEEVQLHVEVVLL